jgi:hypothetical protein
MFVCILVPVYWAEYGPENFLWGSDIALFMTLAALWTESSLLASMAAVAVLLPELGWCIDFALRLILGPEAVPTVGTTYMFDPEIPLLVRGLSLFHIALPALLLWLVCRLGYDRRALLYQTLMAWVVIPATYVLTDPAANINWVHGFGREPQSLMPGPLFLLLLMAIFALGVFLPTHLLLCRLFARDRNRDVTD